MANLAHSFSFDADSGTFTIRAGDDLLLSGASVQVLLADRNLDSVFLPATGIEARDEQCPGLGSGRSQTIRFADDTGLTMSFEAFVPLDGHAAVLRVALQNGSSEAVHVDELRPLVVEGQAGDCQLGMPSSEWAILREGGHSWAPSGVRSLTDEDYHVGGTEPGGFTSHRLAMLVAGEIDRGLLLAWLQELRLSGRVIVARQGDSAAVQAIASADGILLGPGETLTSEPLLVAFTASPLASLEHYGDLFAERMASRMPPPRAKGPSDAGTGAMPSMTGWATWYTNRDISDAMIRENLRRYADEADRWRLDAWIIDDGWQSVAGDWLMVNEEKFPRGMKLVADGIRSAGLKPGLWIAPFMVSEASILAREHVDWLLKDDRGEVVTAFAFSEESHWRGRQFVLDVTHPEAADHVRQVVRTMVREWGYACVKADFLFAAALPGVRHDATLTRNEVMRKAMDLLRDEVGERFLMACGCPIGAAVGTADSCRTGTDVACLWHPPEADDDNPSTRNAIRNVVARYWQHGRFFLADPDALMVRELDTSLTRDEVQTLATVVAMSGGAMMWSDALGAVSAQRRLILDKVLPPWPEAARPVHLFRSERAQTLVWTFHRGEVSWRVVALLNLADRKADLPLNLTDVGCPRGIRHHVFELWRETYHGIVAHDQVTLTAVPPHGTRLLAVRPVTDGLDFLASSLHVTMDALLCRAEPKGLACDVHLESAWRRRGRLFFAAPPGYVVRTADGLLTERNDGCWSIEVDTSLTTEYHLEALHQQRLQ